MLKLIPLRYRIGAAVLAVLAVFAAGYWKGHSAAAGACRAKELQAQIDAMARDRVAAAQAESQERKMMDLAVKEAAGREQELQAYVDKLRGEKECRRTLDRDDVDRLRRIDGKGGR